MTASILTNVGAMTALQTLTSINKDMNVTQDRISTGMEVAKAKDNAAYWAIATTMRTDLLGYQAISDALGLGQATADIASTGNEAIVDQLKEMKQRLVAAQDAGVDKEKINDDIQQMKAQITSVIESANFNGNNWLNGSINDVNGDSTVNGAGNGVDVNILASLVRTGAAVAPQNIVFDPADTAYLGDAADGSGGFFTTTLSTATAADTVTDTGILGANFVIDNTTSAEALAEALTEVEAAIAKATEIGSTLGSIEKRLSIQNDFVTKLADAAERGIGVLVDADMNRESARLKALQVQQQLGVQALNIANSAPQNILALFRG
ncbi:flagellin [Tepidicaulis sp. LMO-SS28]|uniref:flagellin N-terminal helical domain-containing protein n=1 Tax=Tepidicaulis sp. LMO-SS28 TaxID=3447455 RepID=UPI003EE1F2B2